MIDWTDEQALAYIGRTEGISERFKNWIGKTILHPEYVKLSDQMKRDFHDRLLIALSRGTIAHCLPRLP